MISSATSRQARQGAIEIARSIINEKKPIYIDTETTGLGKDDEIIEISIIDDDGMILLETLVRPSKPIPAASTQIHGITNVDVKNARPWPIVWPAVREAMFSRLAIFYNEEFDMRMMQQSHALYRLPWREKFNTFDLLKLYAAYRGIWDPNRRTYRYHSLANAGAQCNIPLPNAHRSTADTLLTRALLHYVAESSIE